MAIYWKTKYFVHKLGFLKFLSFYLPISLSSFYKDLSWSSFCRQAEDQLGLVELPVTVPDLCWTWSFRNTKAFLTGFCSFLKLYLFV